MGFNLHANECFHSMIDNGGTALKRLFLWLNICGSAFAIRLGDLEVQTMVQTQPMVQAQPLPDLYHLGTQKSPQHHIYITPLRR